MYLRNIWLVGCVIWSSLSIADDEVSKSNTPSKQATPAQATKNKNVSIKIEGLHFDGFVKKINTVWKKRGIKTPTRTKLKDIFEELDVDKDKKIKHNELQELNNKTFSMGDYEAILRIEKKQATLEIQGIGTVPLGR